MLFSSEYIFFFKQYTFWLNAFLTGLNKTKVLLSENLDSRGQDKQAEDKLNRNVGPASDQRHKETRESGRAHGFMWRNHPRLYF